MDRRFYVADESTDKGFDNWRGSSTRIISLSSFRSTSLGKQVWSNLRGQCTSEIDRKGCCGRCTDRWMNGSMGVLERERGRVRTWQRMTVNFFTVSQTVPPLPQGLFTITAHIHVAGKRPSVTICRKKAPSETTRMRCYIRGFTIYSDESLPCRCAPERSAEPALSTPNKWKL